MARVLVFLKFLVFVLCVVSAFAIPSFLLLDQYEWMVSAWMGAAAVFLLGLYVEPALLKVHRAFNRPPLGLSATLERVALETPALKEQDLPSVYVIQDPDRYILIAKGWLGSGMIMLSQSFLASVDEGELRSILKNALLSLQRPGITLISIADLAASLVKRLLPNYRIRTPGISPSEAFWFLAVYPFYRFFLWMGRTRDHRNGIRLAPPKSSI